MIKTRKETIFDKGALMMRTTRMIVPLAAAMGLALTMTMMPRAAAATAATEPTQSTGASSADAMYKQYEAITLPHVDRSKAQDPGYRAAFLKQYIAAMKKRAAVAKRFYAKYPNDPRVGKMLTARWDTCLREGKPQDVLNETASLVKNHPDSKAVPDALYFRFVALLFHKKVDGAALEKTADAFVKAAPDDPRGAALLNAVAGRLSDNQKKIAIYQQVQKNYPHTRAAMQASDRMEQAQQVGQPFKLSFDGAITGKHYAIADMKGKPVVVDFWATWCGPCVASMPEMKKMYEKYHPQGVNFIGISLDRSKESGGLDKLKQFVKRHDVPWPQYYEGKGWQNSVAQQWGVGAIPQVFVIDAKGNLYSVDGRGQLDTILPKLLAKKD